MNINRTPQWQRSSFCATNACVEVDFGPDGIVRVRDSKPPWKPVLTFSAGEWDAFIAGVRNGEFDRRPA